MPITFTQPAPNGPFGVGYSIRGTSDFIGPIETGSTWFIQIMDGATGEIATGIEDSLPCTTTTISGEFRHWSRVLFPIPAPHDLAFPGSANRLLVQMRNPLGQVLDSGQVAITWEPHAGAHNVLQQRTGTAAQGGLTPAQDQALMLIPDWIKWDLGGQLVENLLDFLGDVLRSGVLKQVITPDFEGEGSFGPPSLAFTLKWVGVAWDLVTFPPGIGIDEGSPDRTEVDYLAVQYIYLSSIGEPINVEGRYDRRLSGSWYWGLDAPDRFGFYILPGATVTFSYLISGSFAPRVQDRRANPQ